MQEIVKKIEELDKLSKKLGEVPETLFFDLVKECMDTLSYVVSISKEILIEARKHQKRLTSVANGFERSLRKRFRAIDQTSSLDDLEALAALKGIYDSLTKREYTLSTRIGSTIDRTKSLTRVLAEFERLRVTNERAAREASEKLNYLLSIVERSKEAFSEEDDKKALERLYTQLTEKCQSIQKDLETIS